MPPFYARPSAGWMRGGHVEMTAASYVERRCAAGADATAGAIAA